MLNEKLNKAINKQINAELYSAYLYLSMTAYFEELNFKGYANWMLIQTQEEIAHAMGLFNYMHARDGHVELEQIEKPTCTWNSVLEVFESILEHEQTITCWVWELAGIAEEVKDRSAMTFLNWYIAEQVEEEATARELVDKLRLIGDSADALLNLDRELGSRTFTPPSIE